MASVDDVQLWRRRIEDLAGAGLTWDAIATQVGLPVPECQAIARGEHVEIHQEIDEHTAAPVIKVHRVAAGPQRGILMWVHSFGVPRTGKTTLVRELGAMLAQYAKIALVDADVFGNGIYFATRPSGAKCGIGLAAWAGADSPEDALRQSWILPGTDRGYSDPVAVWAFLPGEAHNEPGWAEQFWGWARGQYDIILVDTGEVVPDWANMARVSIDRELVVVPQDPLALRRVQDTVSKVTVNPKVGAVVMGYDKNVGGLLAPTRIADMVNLPLLAAIPYNPRFATWGVTKGTPWFPMQQQFDRDLQEQMTLLVPETWRASPREAQRKAKRWFR